MSNRLLSFFILILLFAGLFGVYYYFFALSTANVSLIINGSGTTSITLASEFGNAYTRDCERSCLFDGIPAVNYTVSAKRDGYAPFVKTFALNRGETRKVMVAMEKEVTLTEQKRKKEETIATLKLKNSIQETMETNTGWTVLGYRNNALYYALPNDTGWSIFIKKEWSEARELFKIPDGTLSSESLLIYEGHIALEKKGNMVFFSLETGKEASLKFDGKVLGVKDTLDDDTKIITNTEWVFMYSVSEKTARKNPLYDDIIQLSSGEIVALVKKTSREKQSLLSITDSSNDYVLLIGQDTRERKILLKTPKNGEVLRYRNGEILFVSEAGEIFVVSNVK